MFSDRIRPDWQAQNFRLSELNQGDVLEGLPVGYFTTGAITACSDSPVVAAEFASVTNTVAPYAIITTQSCDIVEEGRPSVRPLFSVSPVYELIEPSVERRLDIERFRLTYLVRLTGMHFQNGFWVADLTVQTCFDKGVLIDRAVYHGFAHEDDRRKFAEHVSWQYGRPDFPRAIAEHVVDSLRRWLHAKPNRRATMRDLGVEEFRLTCSGSAPPCDACLWVLVDDPNQVKPVQTFFDSWYTSASGKARSTAIRLTYKVRFLDQISGRDYRTAQPLSLA